MFLIGQIGVIVTVSLLGELLNRLLPFPVPASVYGLLLMLLALCTGVIKLHQVEKAADFLLDILTFLLVPISVGLMTSWAELQTFLVPFLVLCTLGTLVVMVVTGLVTQVLLRGKEGKPDESNPL